MDWLVGKRSSETDGYTGRRPLSVFPPPGSCLGLGTTVAVATILVLVLVSNLTCWLFGSWTDWTDGNSAPFAGLHVHTSAVVSIFVELLPVLSETEQEPSAVCETYLVSVQFELRSGSVSVWPL